VLNSCDAPAFLSARCSPQMLRPRRDVCRDSPDRSRSRSDDRASRSPVHARNALSLKPRPGVVLRKRSADGSRSEDDAVPSHGRRPTNALDAPGDADGALAGAAPHREKRRVRRKDKYGAERERLDRKRRRDSAPEGSAEAVISPTAKEGGESAGAGAEEQTPEELDQDAELAHTGEGQSGAAQPETRGNSGGGSEASSPAGSNEETGGHAEDPEADAGKRASEAMEESADKSDGAGSSASERKAVDLKPREKVRKKKRHRRDDPNASADRKHRHAKQAMELERRVNRLGTSKNLGDAKDSQKTKKGATDAETMQLKALIRDVYQRRNPSKIGDLDALFKKYAGSEGDVYSHVCKKYGETPNFKKIKDAGKHAAKLAASPNGSVAAKKPVQGTYARKASAPAPPVSLRVFKFGAVLSPPRDYPSAADLFAAAESSKGTGWPFLGDEDSQNSASSSSSSPERAPAEAPGAAAPTGVWYRPANLGSLAGPPPRRRDGVPLDAHSQGLFYPAAPRGDPNDELYGDLVTSAQPHARNPYIASAPPPPPPGMGMGAPDHWDQSSITRYDPSGAFCPPPPPSRGPDRTPIHLQTFIGLWRDTMSNRVEVSWARTPSRDGQGQLDVSLSKLGAAWQTPLRLNVNQDHLGNFTCGHYNLDVPASHTDKIVWKDVKNVNKRSVWDRERAR